MELSRLGQGLIVVAGVALSGCQTHVEGDYQLDLEQTKECLAKTAAADAEAGKQKDQTLKLLESTQLTIRLDPSGKMLSTTVLTLAGAQQTSKTSGTWKLDGKRVTFKVEDDADTLCEVDGKRLRCHRDADQKLLANYVLIRK